MKLESPDLSGDPGKSGIIQVIIISRWDLGQNLQIGDCPGSSGVMLYNVICRITSGDILLASGGTTSVKRLCPMLG